MKYFDLQVNGYGGVDFNQADLSAEQLHQACLRLQHDGVVGILATLITEDLEVLVSRIRRLVALREKDLLAKQIIHGIHVEGPFISGIPGYVGAHPIDAVLPATRERAAQILEAGDGLIKLVTLAPECDAGSRVTRYLVRQNVIVAAGHTDASLDELRGAIDHGLTVFTHLGNGCPMQMNRHDNIIQRAMYLRERLWIIFIADGTHMPCFALKNYLDLIGTDRAIVVTDAIAPAGLGPGRYTFGRWGLVIGSDMVAKSADGSHFVGSTFTMRQSEEFLLRKIGCTDEQCQKLLFLNPRKAISDS